MFEGAFDDLIALGGGVLFGGFVFNDGGPLNPVLSLSGDVHTAGRVIFLFTTCGGLPYTGSGEFEMPQAAYATKRSSRLDARVSRKEKDLIEAAASLRGISVTDFLRTTVTDAAHRVIRESETLTLSERSRKIFVQALLNPPKPNNAALAAARRFKQEVR